MTRPVGHISQCRTSTRDRLSVSDALSSCAGRRHTHRLCRYSGSVNMAFVLKEPKKVSKGGQIVRSGVVFFWVQINLKHRSTDLRSKTCYTEAEVTFDRHHNRLHSVKRTAIFISLNRGSPMVCQPFEVLVGLDHRDTKIVLNVPSHLVLVSLYTPHAKV